MFVLRQLGLTILLALPAAVLIFYEWRRREQERARSVLPFDELRRRPAGETMRTKVDEISEDFDFSLMMLLILPVVFAVALAAQPRSSVAMIAAFFATTVGLTVMLHRKLRATAVNLRRHRLGFQGEPTWAKNSTS